MVVQSMSCVDRWSNDVNAVSRQQNGQGLEGDWQ